MFKKVITLLFGTALMVVLVLAAGGIYLLPENVMGVYMYADVWNAVGGLFSLMLVPGFVVGYAACQSRILGAVWFIGFVVLGFISGISVWWIVTAVLLILSYIFCISENVGDYDDLDTYDKLCVLIPAFGAMRFIDRFGLEGFFGIIGKILSVLAILLDFVLLFALWIVPKDEASAFGTVIMQIKDFGSTLFGVVVIFVFLPLFSVYSAKYSFIKPGLAKVLACIFGGYDIMRGAFVIMPVLFNTAGGGETSIEGASLVFNNMFGIEACLLMAMLLGGILCVKTAFGKKLALVAQFCLTKDGTASLRCLMMAALSAVLVFSIAPAAIFILWLAAASVILLVTVIFSAMNPGYSYEELRAIGYSDYEARKLIRVTNGSMTAI
ncbi:MAG: hypothetical protein ACI4G1_08590 [Ruminococcus sp.]